MSSYPKCSIDANLDDEFVEGTGFAKDKVDFNLDEERDDGFMKSSIDSNLDILDILDDVFELAVPMEEDINESLEDAMDCEEAEGEEMKTEEQFKAELASLKKKTVATLEAFTRDGNSEPKDATKGEPFVSDETNGVIKVLNFDRKLQRCCVTCGEKLGNKKFENHQCKLASLLSSNGTLMATLSEKKGEQRRFQAYKIKKKKYKDVMRNLVLLIEGHVGPNREILKTSKDYDLLVLVEQVSDESGGASYRLASMVYVGKPGDESCQWVVGSIATLKSYANQRLATYLSDIAFEMARAEGRSGAFETPVSSSGMGAYTSLVLRRLLRALHVLGDTNSTLEGFVQQTALCPKLMRSILSEWNVLTSDGSLHVGANLKALAAWAAAMEEKSAFQVQMHINGDGIELDTECEHKIHPHLLKND